MSVELFKLKYEARRHLLAYRAATEHLDCGAAIAQHISAAASEHARQFDDAMARLREIDPSCPKHEPLAVKE